MLKKVILALTGILIVCDLAVIGISFIPKSSTPTETSSTLYSDNNAEISPVDVRTIVENKANGGVVTSLTFDKSKNQYNVTLDTLKDTYNATVNASTGAITSFVNDNKTPSVDLNFTPNSSNNNGTSFMTASKAIETLNSIIPDGQINQLTYNIVNIEPQYDATITKGSTEYYVDIDASTGKVLSNNSVPIASIETVS